MNLMIRGLLVVAIVGSVFDQAPVQAESFADVATLEAKFEPAQARPGQKITLALTLTPNRQRNAYTYPATKQDQNGKCEIGFGLRDPVILVGDLINPPGAVPKSSDLGEVEEVYKSPVRWEITAIVSPKAKPGKYTIVLSESRFQACTLGGRENCYNTYDPKVELEVLPGEPLPIPDEYKNAVELALQARPTTTPPNSTATDALPQTRSESMATGLLVKPARHISDYRAALEQLRGKIEFADGVSANPTGRSAGVFALLITAAFWGLVSLVTPCVFPMIPITVSLFLKQSQQSTAEVLKLALIYCLTIIVVLGASAVFLLSLFRELSVDPLMNLFLAGLFVFFALSLFGMYDITLPGFLLRYTEKRRGAGGVIGTIFGALAFSIVSFTCVAPFLGGFAGMTASGNYHQVELILAGIVFAAAFASPFFLLAIFPSLLKSLPRSGGWLDTVKAVMGFLELAAAFKFVRTAELRILERTHYFTYDLCLAAWIGISLVTGAYLLNFFRLPHDEESSKIGVIRMLLAVAFISLGIYLVPALFKADGQSQRPAGAVYAWVDAFLLPEPLDSGGKELPWGADLPAAVARIRQDKLAGIAKKPLVFVDFTGVTCTNCKLNEREIFTQAKVRDLLAQYTLVQLYTDEVPAAFYEIPPAGRDRKQEAMANLEFQRSVFGTEQLPLYAILEPLISGTVRVVAVYDEGKINDEGRFLDFLAKPLKP
jgi:thiol:disulfide interchange protein